MDPGVGSCEVRFARSHTDYGRASPPGQWTGGSCPEETVCVCVCVRARVAEISTHYINLTAEHYILLP